MAWEFNDLNVNDSPPAPPNSGKENKKCSGGKGNIEIVHGEMVSWGLGHADW